MKNRAMRIPVPQGVKYLTLSNEFHINLSSVDALAHIISDV